MKLILQRVKEYGRHTLSLLHYVSDNRIIHTTNCIELKWKENRRAVSRIPEGVYDLEYEWSPKFKRKLWEFKDIPNRDEIKFHKGSNWSHTNGCPVMSQESLDFLHERLVNHLTYQIQVINSIIK